MKYFENVGIVERYEGCEILREEYVMFFFLLKIVKLTATVYEISVQKQKS